jgi:hypothetical protein
LEIPDHSLDLRFPFAGRKFVDNAFFLAMSYRQLANHAVARKWLSDAIEAFDQQALPIEELRRFRKCAERLATRVKGEAFGTLIL